MTYSLRTLPQNHVPRVLSARLPDAWNPAHALIWGIADNKIVQQENWEKNMLDDGLHVQD